MTTEDLKDMFDIKEYSVGTLMNDMIEMTTEQIKTELEGMLETQKDILKTTGIEYLYSRWFNNFSPSSLIDYAIVYLNKEELFDKSE